MNSIGLVVVIFGTLIVLLGLAGFVDTRTVDRRFKTGYRNNEADTRNFGHSIKRAVYGVGVIVVGAAVMKLSSPDEHVSSERVDEAASLTRLVEEPASKISSVEQLHPASVTGISDANAWQASNEYAAAAATMSQPTSVAERGKTQPQVSQTMVECADDGTYFGANVSKNLALADAYSLEVKEYEAAQARIGGNDLGVRAEQEVWLQRATKDCVDMACLANAFDNRIADLRGRYRRQG
jgi:hypothetical protein